MNTTPAAKWRVNGQEDPFKGQNYDGERAALCKGHLTDDEMANEVYLSPDIANLTAAKERIRWLSRSLVRATKTHGMRFQFRVDTWMDACFGPVISSDTNERNHRFLEEALELVQACDCTASEAHQLVDYVFNRPVGEKTQEVGGVMVTLAALCLAQRIDMAESGEVELTRIWTKVEQIRAKQAAKPKHSPLPA